MLMRTWGGGDEYLQAAYNRRQTAHLYYWRDSETLSHKIWCDRRGVPDRRKENHGTFLEQYLSANNNCIENVHAALEANTAMKNADSLQLSLENAHLSSCETCNHIQTAPAVDQNPCLLGTGPILLWWAINGLPLTRVHQQIVGGSLK